MKKNRLILSILFGLFLLSVVSLSSAYNFTINDKFDKKETMVVKLSGYFVEPIKKDDVEFKKINVNYPLEYDLIKIDSTYYIWAIAPNDEGKYTLRIKGAVIYDNGAQEEKDIETNFSVGNKSIDYYVSPAVISNGTDFEINIFSNLDDKTEIKIGAPINQNINIYPGENEYSFKLQSEKDGLVELEVGKYKLPIFVKGTGKPYSPDYPAGKRIIVVPSRIEGVLLVSGDRPVYRIMVNNTDELERSIRFDYNSRKIRVEPTNDIKLKPGESYYYNVSVLTDINSSFNDVIGIDYSSSSEPEYVELAFNFTTDVNKTSTTLTRTNMSNSQVLLSCNELGGYICNANRGEFCESGSSLQSLDSMCCQKKCIVGESSGSSSGAWGWILLIIVIGVIGYLGYKYMKTGKVGAPSIGAS